MDPIGSRMQLAVVAMPYTKSLEKNLGKQRWAKVLDNKHHQLHYNTAMSNKFIMQPIRVI